MKYPLTNNRWQAIKNNDATKDGTFFYGVTTTKIFCKPSCVSRLPNKEHILIFKTAAEAQALGFRPCKRCSPTGKTLSNEAWINEIKDYLETNFQISLTLDTIALDCHGSVSNLQRTFKSITGLSPTQYLQELRLSHSQTLLQQTELSIKAIAFRVGFNSDTYFNTLFKKRFHQTPQIFRDNYRHNKKISDS